MRHFCLSCLSGLCHQQAAINPGTAVLPCHADKEVCLVYSFYSETLYSPVSRTKVSFCLGACFLVPLSIPQNLFARTLWVSPSFGASGNQWRGFPWTVRAAEESCEAIAAWDCFTLQRTEETECYVRWEPRVPAAAIRKLSSSHLPRVGKGLARLELPTGNSGCNWSTEALCCLKVFNKMFRKGF